MQGEMLLSGFLAHLFNKCVPMPGFCQAPFWGRGGEEMGSDHWAEPDYVPGRGSRGNVQGAQRLCDRLSFMGGSVR